MAADPVVKLRLLDVYGKPLNQPTMVMCRNQVTGRVLSVQVPAGRAVTVKGLTGAPAGLHLLQIDPAAYLPCGTFIDVPATGAIDVTLTFAIDHARVEDVTFPSFARLPATGKALLRDHGLKDAVGEGRQLYDDGLDNLRKAGFLNIVAKTSVTTLPNGRPVASYFTRLEDLRGDRFFCTVPQALRDDVKNAAMAGLFNEVSSSLHHPPEGFTHAGSFKTPENYGNLQLTFFAGPDRWVADVDIDDAGGLGHVFQVLRNSLTGRPTHPYDIHEILVAYQRLDPGYRFSIASGR